MIVQFTATVFDQTVNAMHASIMGIGFGIVPSRIPEEMSGLTIDSHEILINLQCWHLSALYVFRALCLQHLETHPTCPSVYSVYIDQSHNDSIMWTPRHAIEARTKDIG